MADYYDADTGEIIYTDTIENWNWDNSVVFTYEPRYTFYDEQKQPDGEETEKKKDLLCEGSCV